MVNMVNGDEESQFNKYAWAKSTSPTPSQPTTSLETTPLWIHSKETDEFDMPSRHNPAHSRRRIMARRLPGWICVAFLAVLLAGWYLYGFSNIEVPGREYVDILRSKIGKGLRVSKLPSKFLPQTGKNRQSGRLVIVGDVHGMKNELAALLKKVDFDSKQDHLILIGDMIDKGPDSAGVIDLAMEVGASCVMGNHEHKAIRQNSQELRHMGKKRANWIRRCPHILRVGELGEMGEVMVVHAGLQPGKNLRAQKAKNVMNMRTIDKHGKPSARKEGVDWFKRWNQYQKTLPQEDRSTVVYGHNSGLGLQDHVYTKGIDTGCVNGGSLTALVIEGGSTHHRTNFIAVDCKYGRQ